MVTYVISQQTHILSIEDINIICFCKRIDEENNAENFTIFRKVGNLFQLTNSNMKSIIASGALSVEIAQSNPEIHKSEDKDLAFGLMYKKLGDNPNNFFIETLIDNNIESATSIFDERIKSYENVDPESITVFQIGALYRSDQNKALETTRFIIFIDEKNANKIFIKKGYDSLNEFNRKIYECRISREVIESK